MPTIRCTTSSDIRIGLYSMFNTKLFRRASEFETLLMHEPSRLMTTVIPLAEACRAAIDQP